MDGPDFKLTLITNEPAWLRAGDDAGVDRIGIDIERIPEGMRERRSADDRLSPHALEDMGNVSATLRSAAPFIRINRMHSGTPTEIDSAIGAGASVIMLPGFRNKDEVEQFLEWVGGRAESILLLETSAAVSNVRDWLTVPGVTEVFIGMNDLHMELKLSSSMELLASDLMRDLSEEIRAAGRRFGCGGVARPDDRDLPVPADLVLANYARLGGQSAWIARSFFQGGLTPTQFGCSISSLRSRLAYWASQPASVLAESLVSLRRVLKG